MKFGTFDLVVPVHIFNTDVLPTIWVPLISDIYYNTVGLKFEYSLISYYPLFDNPRELSPVLKYTLLTPKLINSYRSEGEAERDI